MKKLFVLFLTALLLVTMSGCVDGATSVKEPSNIITGGGNQDTGNVAPADNESNNSLDITVSEPTNNSVTETISEAVLVDESGVKITAKSLDKSGWLGPEIKLMIENNSGKDLTFQCRNASVNGYMVETMMSVDVTNGKKANDSVTFLSSDLEMSGIKTMADIELSFHIFDADSWDTYLDTSAVTISTSAADGYEYSFDDSGSVAYEGNGIKIIVKGLAEEDSFFGKDIIVCIVNSSDQAITVQARDVSVNGFMIDPIFSADVCADKRAFDTITFMSSDIEDNSITEINEVELSFHVFSPDSWDAIVDTPTIKIEF